MKRFYLFTVLFCAFCSVTVAQKKDYFKDKKHELRLSYGSVNDEAYYDMLSFNNYNYYSSGYGLYYGYGNNSYLNASIYQGATKTTGVFGLNYFYNMSSLRFSFGGGVSYSGFNTDFYNRINDLHVGSIKMHNIAITPMIRYSWISKEKLRLYSGIGWSFYWDILRPQIKVGEGSNISNSNQTISDNVMMLTPIGFSFGKDIFVFGEVNLGGRTGNFVGGVGYRF